MVFDFIFYSVTMHTYIFLVRGKTVVQDTLAVWSIEQIDLLLGQ